MAMLIYKDAKLDCRRDGIGGLLISYQTTKQNTAPISPTRSCGSVYPEAPDDSLEQIFVGQHCCSRIPESPESADNNLKNTASIATGESNVSIYQGSLVYSALDASV